MPVVFFFKILGGIAAVALGIFLGAGQFTQSQEDIEARMGSGKSRKAKRHFMWIETFSRRMSRGVRRPDRAHFKTAVGRDKEDRP